MGVVERFWSMVDTSAGLFGCWEWLAHRVGGYGHISWRGKDRPAHRVGYELLVGPVPDGKQLDHLCRNRGCVNPAHLEPVSQAENMARGVCWDRNRRKTHCPAGHPYDAQNTLTRPGPHGLTRRCAACHRDRERERRRQCQAA